MKVQGRILTPENELERWLLREAIRKNMRSEPFHAMSIDDSDEDAGDVYEWEITRTWDTGRLKIYCTRIKPRKPDRFFVGWVWIEPRGEGCTSEVIWELPTIEQSNSADFPPIISARLREGQYVSLERK